MSPTAKAPSQEWRWRDGLTPFGDAQEIGEELVKIARRKGHDDYQSLSVKDVIDAARSARYPALHKILYEVDRDRVLAQWRVATARKILCNLGYQVVNAGETAIHIARPSVIIEGERRYVPTPHVVTRPAFRDTVIRDAWKTIEAQERRLAEIMPEEQRPGIIGFFVAVGEAARRGRQSEIGPSPAGDA